MKEKINEIVSKLNELNYKYIVANSSEDVLILFYNQTNTKAIIYGISLSKSSLYIDVGNLIEEHDGKIILGCVYRTFNFSEIKKNMQLIFQQTQDLIKQNEQVEYLSIEMKPKQKFSNVKTIIEQFLKKYNYSIYR